MAGASRCRSITDARDAQIHPTAIVDEGARIGEATRIWHWTHISAGARIGAIAHSARTCSSATTW
jgi:acyl-[acyl carrier protein]--UDP-N-acetylglucosamine O-acyltransferase